MLNGQRRFECVGISGARVGRWSWLLLVPFVLALAVKVPLTFAVAGRLDNALGPWSRRLWLLAATTAIDIVLLALLLAGVLTRAWRALAGPPRDAVDQRARQEARRLLAEGYRGLVVGHTRSPVLADLGSGFFADMPLSGWAELKRVISPAVARTV